MYTRLLFLRFYLITRAELFKGLTQAAGLSCSYANPNEVAFSGHLSDVIKYIFSPGLFEYNQSSMLLMRAIKVTPGGCGALLLRLMDSNSRSTAALYSTLVQTVHYI